MAKKSRKCSFLFNEQQLERVVEFRIYFSILEGVILLQLFLIHARFWDMRFWGKNLSSKKRIFEKYPFTTAVSVSFDPLSAQFWNSSTNPTIPRYMLLGLRISEIYYIELLKNHHHHVTKRTKSRDAIASKNCFTNDFLSKR